MLSACTRRHDRRVRGRGPSRYSERMARSIRSGGIALIAGAMLLGLLGPVVAAEAAPGPSAASAVAPVAAVAHPVLAAKTYKNCTALNKKYPHGVGRKGARDRVRGRTKPVRNFKVSTALYNANKKSDRDKDGVACEKH